MTLIGMAAIEYAEKYDLNLNKFADPIEMRVRILRSRKRAKSR